MTSPAADTTRLIDELADLSNQVDTIELEIATFTRGQLDQEMQQQMTEAQRSGGGNVEVDEEHQLWPFRGEYWRDELGFYRQQVTQPVWSMSVVRMQTLNTRNDMNKSPNRSRLTFTVLGALALGAGMLLGASPAAAQGMAAAPQRNAASAGGQCITPGAVSAVNECPSNAPAPSKRNPSASAPRSRLRTAAPQKQGAKQGPTGPSVEISSATRTNRQQSEARAANLLEREVQILKRLVQNTRANNPQRPEILLRLAETYFEMQTSLNIRVRSFDEPISPGVSSSEEPAELQPSAARSAAGAAPAGRDAAGIHPDLRDLGPGPSGLPSHGRSALLAGLRP